MARWWRPRGNPPEVYITRVGDQPAYDGEWAVFASDRILGENNKHHGRVFDTLDEAKEWATEEFEVERWQRHLVFEWVPHDYEQGRKG